MQTRRVIFVMACAVCLPSQLKGSDFASSEPIVPPKLGGLSHSNFCSFGRVPQVSAGKPQKQNTAPSIKKNRPVLQTRFKIGEGVLVVEHYGEELPSSRRLVLRKPNGKTLPIRSLSDLRGYVKISSGEEALNYVRLLTSPRTFRCFNHTVEVVAKKWVNVDYMFGDRNSLEYHKKHNERGIDGILNSAKCKILKVNPPRIEKTHQGFVITRVILERDEFIPPLGSKIKYVQSNKVMGYQITELVGTEGQYQEVKRVKLPQLLWSQYLVISRLR